MALLPVAKAKTHILKGVNICSGEYVEVRDAAGRVLAKDLKAKRNQPPFAASAMDGYAVKAQDIAKTPVKLEVIGEAPAGRQFSGLVKSGQAVRIFTGAPVPRGADTVVMQENALLKGETVTIKQSAKFGNFIRPAGLDFKKSEIVLTADTVLNARNVGLCAAMNYAKVPVRRKPVVAILATGDELVEPGDKVRADQIVSSNSVALAAAVKAFGGEPVNLGIVPDHLSRIEAAIKSASKADILITIGGASVGDHDLIGPAFKSLGIKLDFWKIAMRPGKPLIFATKGKQRILGLPGNPVSSLVCARIFLKPLIETMLGLKNTDVVAQAKLASPLPANDLRQDYIRAKLSRDDQGRLLVTPFSKQDSSMQRVFANSDALIIRAPHAKPARAGANVKYLPVDF